MKWVSATICAVLIAALIIFFVPSFHVKAVSLLSYSACDTPQQYKIGSVDPRFNISKAVALSDIKSATNIWSSAHGKNLFEYSPDAKLTVNFIYDQRQALNTQINQLNSQVSQQNADLKQKIDQYRLDSADFKKRLNDFTDTIDEYNKEGGAPQDVYDNLVKQQDQLKSEADSLNQRAKDLNLSADNYNSDVLVLNQDVNQFNIALAKKPEEGLYDGEHNTISIYFVNSHNELVHTLAHEFGHALGMEHVKNPKSVMYTNTTNYLVPTSADLSQLNYVCRKQVAILHWLGEIDLWIYGFLQSITKNLTHLA